MDAEEVRRRYGEWRKAVDDLEALPSAQRRWIAPGVENVATIHNAGDAEALSAAMARVDEAWAAVIEAFRKAT